MPRKNPPPCRGHLPFGRRRIDRRYFALIIRRCLKVRASLTGAGTNAAGDAAAAAPVVARLFLDDGLLASLAAFASLFAFAVFTAFAFLASAIRDATGTRGTSVPSSLRICIPCIRISERKGIWTRLS